MGPWGTSWGCEWFSAFPSFPGPPRLPWEAGLGVGEAGGVAIMSRVPSGAANHHGAAFISAAQARFKSYFFFFLKYKTLPGLGR